MSTILVVDDMAIFREPLSMALERAGYSVLTATNGREALSVIGNEGVDLLLLDLAMPEMDGLTFLSTIRQNPAYQDLPVILLTAVAQKDVVINARALGVSEYLVKSYFTLDKLLGSIKTALKSPDAAPADSSASEVAAPTSKPASGKTLSPAETAERIKKPTRIRTLLGVVQQILEAIDSDGSSATEVAEALSADPVIGARVLKLANSAAYAGPNEPSANLPEAVMKLGFSTIRNISAAVGLFDSFAARDDDGFSMLRCWEHSLAVAQIMERMQDGSNAALAHLVGLYHHLPELLLRQEFEGEYLYAAELARARGKPLQSVVEEVLGRSYPELSALVLDSHRLPKRISAPIVEYLRSPLRGRSGTKIVQTLRIANFYAHGMMLAPSPSASLQPLTKEELIAASSSATVSGIDPYALRSNIETTTAYLHKLSAKQGQAPAPLFPWRNVQILYVRHPVYHELDPISFGLQSLAQTVVTDSVPQNIGSYSAVVAAVPGSQLLKTPQFELEALLKTVRSDIPILYLTDGAGSTYRSSLSNVFPSQLPITLRDLATFISKLS